MKAVLYKDSSGATLSEVPVPAIGPGEALLAVDACGLCGTDVMKLVARKTGSVLGHELAGRIAKLGSKVKNFKEGDRVIVAHHVPCLDCHYCRRASYSMCRQFKATNIDPGGFAEYVRVPELHVRHTMLPIPKGLDPVSASQTEPLACCLRNVKRLGLREGDTAGIVGLGAIGLMTAQLLSLRQVAVLGIDLDGARAQGISKWGRGFTNAAAIEQEIFAATGGRGLDALIFTAGPSASVEKRLSWLRDGGTLNSFASFHPSHIKLDLNEIYHRELSIMSSYSPGLEDLKESLELIASKAVSVDALKPKSYGLDEFDSAVRQARAREVMKAVFLPAERVCR